MIVFLGIALGAFGAHSLEAKLVGNGHVATWKTAALYHLIHGVALFALALNSTAKPRIPFYAWIAGIILFSGSLYALSITGISKLGDHSSRWPGFFNRLGGTGFVSLSKRKVTFTIIFFDYEKDPTHFV